MRRQLTILTCDRSSKEQRYECRDGDFDDPVCREEWASYWPATVSHLGVWQSHVSTPQTVCHGCLTDFELQALTRQRLEQKNPSFF